MLLELSQTQTESSSQTQTEPSSQTQTEPSSQSSDTPSECQLVRVNAALQLLEQSPIPKKKIKIQSWVTEKLDKSSNAMKQALHIETENPNPDKVALMEMLRDMREKFENTDTKKNEKIQILTLLPTSWSVSKIQSEFPTSSVYLIRLAKTLKSTKGILSTPERKHGKNSLVLTF